MAQMGRPSYNGVPGSALKPEPDLRPPKHLTADERAEWRSLLKHNKHLNSPSYSQLIEAFVGAVVRRRDAMKLVRQEGLTITLGNGSIKAHPSIGTAQSAESTINQLSAKLSLTPNSRKEHGKKADAEPTAPPRPRKTAGGVAPLRLA